VNLLSISEYIILRYSILSIALILLLEELLSLWFVDLFVRMDFDTVDDGTVADEEDKATGF